MVSLEQITRGSNPFVAFSSPFVVRYTLTPVSASAATNVMKRRKHCTDDSISEHRSKKVNLMCQGFRFTINNRLLSWRLGDQGCELLCLSLEAGCDSLIVLPFEQYGRQNTTHDLAVSTQDSTESVHIHLCGA
jgi:hypothetical protein